MNHYRPTDIPTSNSGVYRNSHIDGEDLCVETEGITIT